MKYTATTDENEVLLQKQYMEKAAGYVAALEEEIGHKPLCCVTTFGCQMNARDSEKLSGILKEIGYTLTESEEDADFVIYNTCTVRDNANQRVYGRLGFLNSMKRKKPHLKIALCGCMMQEPSVIEKIRKSYRFVDLIFGTHNIFKFAQLLVTMFENNDMIIDIWQETDQIVEALPVSRKYPYKSGINIMFGCNNFCSYCIVPYVRGRERSRKPEDIIAEVKKLAAEGIVEVMLLGQNVNSYGKTLDTPMSFAELLREVEQVDGIERIRFMTSHPKDLSDELIEVMRQSKKICRHLHLPMQSGSTEILRRMNRKYTKEDYLALVGKIKTAMPEISLTTDIIVGFPGETEDDFLDTLDVVAKAGFDSAYTFLYSKRTGTPAAMMENQVSKEVAKERFNRLLALVSEQSAKLTAKHTGEVEEVLVEEQNEQDGTLMTGRLSNNLLVHFPGDVSLIGKLVSVKLTECKGFYYVGRLEE